MTRIYKLQDFGSLVNNVNILANVNARSRSLYAIARPSVCRLSVTFVHPTQPVKIFGNFSSPFGHPLTFTESFTEIFQWNHSVRGGG